MTTDTKDSRTLILKKKEKRKGGAIHNQIKHTHNYYNLILLVYTTRQRGKHDHITNTSETALIRNTDIVPLITVVQDTQLA